MDKLKTLLDRVYELEGLIHLALSRNDDASARIALLIAAKGESVSRALAEFEMNAVPADADLPEGDNPLAELEDFISYSLEEEEEKNIREKIGGEPEETDVVRSTDADFAVDSEERAEPETIPGHEVPEQPGESHEVSDGLSTLTEQEEIFHIEEKVPESQKKRNLRSLFSINDRFRFSRELFGGSTRKFDDSLAYIDGAIDFNEVEDFFIEDQGFDPESDTVREFLDVLFRSFAD